MPELTAADAAKLVKRQVPELKEGQPTGKTVERALDADEVLSFRVDQAGAVTVVTTDGQKLNGALKGKAS